MKRRSPANSAARTERRALVRRLLNTLRPYRLQVAAVFLGAVISVLASLTFSIFLGEGVDCLVGVGQIDLTRLVRIMLWLALLAALGGLGEWMMQLCANSVAFAVVRDLRRAAFAKLQSLPLSYLDTHAKGDVLARLVTDVDQISDGLILGFTQLFSALTGIVATLAFMFAYNYKIALVVLFLTPLSLVLAAVIARKTYRYFTANTADRGAMSAFVQEMVTNQKTVALFSRERANELEFDRLNRRHQRSSVRAVFLSSTVNPTTRFVNGLVYAAVAVVGAIEVIAGGGAPGAFTVGKLTAFLTYANKYTKPFNEISEVISELQGAMASAKRVFALIDAAPEPPDPADAVVFSDAQGDVTFKNVDFSYDSKKELIKDFNLTVHAGQRIAIVGPTGSGKTTLINLLMRFYQPQAGAITLDGVDLRAATRDSVRRSYGMVLQETWLIRGTVEQNIAYGAPSATHEQVVRAARAAHAHAFIQRLPQGYDTVLSADMQVSEGQKQLLCIARAMLRLPPMLILDEATSSVDTRTELAIRRAFDEISRGRTTFTVAHRLSTIKGADCILVLHHGKVVEQGTHEQLLAQNGFYAALYRAQFENT